MMLRRAIAMMGAVGVVGLVSAAPAIAKTHQASIGNYYYQHDATLDRKKIVVTKGDQIVFTAVEGAVPPHTVDVDALDIHSGAILLGQTYTTPPLKKIGNFLLYCEPHRDRGHHSRLIVKPAAVAATAEPETTSAPSVRPTSTAGTASAPTETFVPGQTALPLPKLVVPGLPREEVPSGIGEADPEALAQAPTDPDSLEGLLGRNVGGQPWTRAVWWLGFAAVPIIGAAALALRRHSQLRLLAAAAAAEALAEAARAASKKKRKPAPKKR